jgi:hypothetical protein
VEAYLIDEVLRVQKVHKDSFGSRRVELSVVSGVRGQEIRSGAVVSTGRRSYLGMCYDAKFTMDFDAVMYLGM